MECIVLRVWDAFIRKRRKSVDGKKRRCRVEFSRAVVHGSEETLRSIFAIKRTFALLADFAFGHVKPGKADVTKREYSETDPKPMFECAFEPDVDHAATSNGLLASLIET